MQVGSRGGVISGEFTDAGRDRPIPRSAIRLAVLGFWDSSMLTGDSILGFWDIGIGIGMGVLNWGEGELHTP